MNFNSTTATAPVIPSEAFHPDGLPNLWLALPLILTVGVLSVVLLATSEKRDSFIQFLGGILGVLSAVLFVFAGGEHSRDVREEAIDKAAKPIEATHGVSIDRDAIDQVEYKRSVIEPVGRFKTDASKIVYGSYVDGDVQLFIASGAEYVPLTK